MHFWIDKRSHACGFGRSRVAASLSNTGWSFGHYPRNINKSLDCRPHVHVYRWHQNQWQPNSNNERRSHQTQTQSSGRNQRALSLPSVHHIQSQQRPQQIAYNSQQQTTSDQHSVQPSNNRRLNTHLSMGEFHTAQSAVIGEPHEESSVDNLEQVQSVIGHSSTVINETPLLPTHLKYGVCASLALTIIFVAAFQGSNLEAASITACAISLFTIGFTFSYFYYSRNVPPLTNLEQLNLPETSITVERGVGPPPPYHIAVLLPKKSEEIEGESPPPSYDKLVV